MVLDNVVIGVVSDNVVIDNDGFKFSDDGEWS